MSFQSWSIEELNVWRRHGYLEDRIRDILRPHEMLWPRDELELASSYASVQRTLPIERRHLLPQALAAAALSHPRKTPDWALQWLQSEVDLTWLGLSLSWEAACHMRWVIFPVAIAEKKRGVLYWVLAGFREEVSTAGSLPPWWPNIADEDTVKSVYTALKLIEMHKAGAFHFLPIAPFTDRMLFRGASLGLPFYLAGYGLYRRFAPEGVLATGILEEDGSLLPVGGIDVKAAAAEKEGLRAVLCPLGSGPKPTLDALPELYEVETLQEAGFICELYEPGKGSGLQSDFKSMSDPRRLAANIHLLSSRAVLSTIFAQDYLETINALLEDWDLTRHFLDNLERMADSAGYPLRKMDALMAPFTPASICKFAGRNPLAAFRVAQLQLLNSSRKGSIEASGTWSSMANDLLSVINRDEPGMEFEASHINRRVVAERHGRYDFRPVLPPELMEMVQKLEELNAIRKRHGSGAVSTGLGKLYGTMAQNYGFCGPEFLHETVTFVERAQEAFGRGVFQGSRMDWQRQFCYLFYAHLDAGNLSDAQNAIENYLEVTPGCAGEDVFNTMNPYQHAALARYLAETEEINPQYHHWCCRKLHDRPPQHPWGLWLSNVGRFLQEPRSREIAWSRAIEISSNQGITAKVMGLLALAHLWEEGLGDRCRLEKETGALIAGLSLSSLSQEHFRCLLIGKSWEAILEKVLDCQAKLFPFTYR